MIGPRVIRALALWLVFFAICLGLGYATANRFDPRNVKGLSDSIDYSAMVADGVPSHANTHRPYRVLVPFIARPFSLLVAKYIEHWNPIATGMMVSNSLFVATTLLLVVLLALRTGLDASEALLAALCFATNFIVVNLYLVGLVDSTEACAATLMFLGLSTRRAYLLALAGLIGGLGKETFVVIGPTAAAAYWFGTGSRRRESLWMLAATFAMSVIALASVIAVRCWGGAETVNPFALAAGFAKQRPFWQKLVDCIFSLHFFYGLYWLLPLSVWALGRISLPLRYGTITGGLVALALGVYHDSHAGNVARPIFSYCGGMLCMAAAVTLIRLANPLAKPQQN